MVLHGDDGAVTGLLVDSVRDVLRIPEEQMRSATGGDNEAVAALLVRGDEFVSLLDLDRVLDLGSKAFAEVGTADNLDRPGLRRGAAGGSTASTSRRSARSCAPRR